MRCVVQSMLVAVMTIGFVSPSNDLTQSPSPRSEMVLEVMATSSTMTGEDTYVFLRVFSDGTAECQLLNRGDLEKKETPTIKKALSQDGFVRIKSVLSNSRLAKLKSRYETRYAIVDTSTEWTIKVLRPGQTQVIQVLEFAPGLARAMKHPYPDALVKLGCSIEDLRAELSGEPNFHDGECKRILGTKSRSWPQSAL